MEKYFRKLSDSPSHELAYVVGLTDSMTFLELKYSAFSFLLVLDPGL
jgi:hypothetical protein